MDISDLNVGDRCCYITHGIGGRKIVSLKIDRITPSGRIVTGTMTWNPDGSLRGASEYSRTGRLMPVTDEIQGEITKQAQVKRLNEVDWNKIPDECRHSIIGLLNIVGQST